MLSKIECPCCHGVGSLLIYDEAYPNDPPQRVNCMHCCATGKVDAETDDAADEQGPP